ESAEQLVAEDTDASVDLYQRRGGLTTLLSTGASGGNGAFDVRYAGLSEDGSRAFFYTQEQLAPADTDTDFDLYARSATTTTLIPGGNSAASFADSSADGTH